MDACFWDDLKNICDKYNIKQITSVDNVFIGYTDNGEFLINGLSILTNNYNE